MTTGPGQQSAAQESYRQGQALLQRGNYSAAVTAFKKALEKFPGLTEAYIGLADAYSHLSDDVAAELNARHALAQLKNKETSPASDGYLRQGLAYGHRVLGTTLLHRARITLEHHDASNGSMTALEAASHCNLASTLDGSDEIARSCAKQARALATAS